MKDELYEEQRKMRILRLLVDLTEASLIQSVMTPAEAYCFVRKTRKTILTLFPGKEEVYDLIYGPRFQRIIDEKFAIPGTFSGRN